MDFPGFGQIPDGGLVSSPGPKENPGNDTFCVQITPSDRSKCNGCCETISMGSVRFGTWYTPFWTYRHVECVTREDIQAAVEKYGSVGGIPSVKYDVGAREDCDKILSGILNVSIESKFSKLLW